MPSAEPGESGLAPAYGAYVGSLTPPTTTAAPEAVVAGAAAVVVVDAAVGFVAATSAVGVPSGALVGAGVDTDGAAALHAASSGRLIEPSTSVPSTLRRVGRTFHIPDTVCR